ncbi:MAG: hypothetical protein JW839_12115 [Candidatus Lokiarchaeota archaeon]|nr:hypothetical protein [Candidatus Lokiarchaeota archaeon]
MGLHPERQGFCIYCRKHVSFNPDVPACTTCGGVCSMTMRFSSTEDAPSYCHACGEPAYVSASNPLCDSCKARPPSP